MLRVAYSFPNRIGVPGIGTTAWHQIKGLVDSGAQVTLFCGSCEKPVPGIHHVVETLKLFGLKVPYRLIGRHRAPRLHDYIVSLSLARVGREFDVLHCWPLGSLRTLYTAKSLGLPTFLERPNTHTAFAYDAVALEHSRIGLQMPKGYTHAFDSRKLTREEAEYAAADRLLCPSEFVAATFTARGFPAEKIARHQYGYDPSRFSFTLSSLHRENQPFTMAFVGRCEPRKGLHYALHAWHQSGAAQHGRFLICGSFMEGYRSLLKKWLDHPSVEVLGFVSDVQSIMQQSDVLVLPAVEEGSALVTYEARGAGCVLLVSDATGAICEHNRDGLVHRATNAEELTAQLRSLMIDQARLRELRRLSIENLAPLTWQHATRRLLACYASSIKDVQQ